MAKRKKPSSSRPSKGAQIGGDAATAKRIAPRSATEKRKRLFAFEFMRCGASIPKASRAVGVCVFTGRKYLGDPVVKAIINEEMSKRSGASKLSVERVLREIAAMAFTVMQDYASWTAHHVALVGSKELTRDQGRCVQSVEETKDGRVKIKLYDKTKVIALAAQVLKMIGVDAQAGQQSASESAALIRKMLGAPLAAEPTPAPTREDDQRNLRPCVGEEGK